MLSVERYIHWLDSLGSALISVGKEGDRLELRGIPCRDFNHRGFELVSQGAGAVVVSALGAASAGPFDSMDEALVAGMAAVAGINVKTEPPRLRPIGPAAALACRDWTIHEFCFPSPPTLEREDTVQALLDGLAGNCLVALEAFPGAGAHAVIAELARRVLEASVPASLTSARVLELDWLKLNADQTRAGALGSGERLAQVLNEIWRSEHIPIIPRGRAQELARVLPGSFRGVVLCNSPVESGTLAAFTNVVRMRLPDLQDSELRLVVQSAARDLEQELEVVVPDEAIEMLLERAAEVEDPAGPQGPLAYQVEPGSCVTALRVACQRARVLDGDRSTSAGKPVVTPGVVAMSLIDMGVNEDTVMNVLGPIALSRPDP